LNFPYYRDVVGNPSALSETALIVAFPIQSAVAID
jgi:hypothetical protein